MSALRVARAGSRPGQVIVTILCPAPKSKVARDDVTTEIVQLKVMLSAPVADPRVCSRAKIAIDAGPGWPNETQHLK